MPVTIVRPKRSLASTFGLAIGSLVALAAVTALAYYLLIPVVWTGDFPLTYWQTFVAVWLIRFTVGSSASGYLFWTRDDR